MRVAPVVSALLLSAAASAARADVVTFNSLAGYQAATAITNTADFEGLTQGGHADPLVQDGIRFHNLEGGHGANDLYISTPGDHSFENAVSPASNILTASGDEDFRIQLNSGADFYSIALDIFRNRFGAPVVSLYQADGTLIGAFAASNGPDTVGFLGLQSAVAIGYATLLVDRGFVEDNGIDNVRIGAGAPTAAGAVPEPASWALMIAGFGLAGSALRRRRPAVTA